MDSIGLEAFIIFIISFILSLAAVGFIIKLSHKNGWFDRICDRKIHDGDIPRLGGMGFATVFLLVTIGICLIFRETVPNSRYLPCLIALFIVMAFGIFDDFRPLAPRYKLLVQIVAALIVIIPGFVFKRLVYIDIGLFPTAFGFCITLLWIVGMSNAINLIDGIDGLAGGLSGLIALSFGFIFFFHGVNPQKVLYCSALVGVIAGFLIFNAPSPKAKIFMGDGGSLFLGFALAMLPLLAEPGTTAALPVPYAAALFLIPIFDTLSAIWRRIRDRRHIASPDKSHLHHKLMNLGLSVQGVNVVLYSLQIILGVLVFVSLRLDGLLSLYVLGSAYIIVTVFFSVIHFMNRAVSRSKGIIYPQPSIEASLWMPSKVIK